MINIYIPILIVSIMSSTGIVKNNKVNQNAKASVSNSVQDKLDKNEKILQFIKLVQPKFSRQKCENIRNSIVKYANKYKIDPYVITTTAYIESEFSNNSRPCIGIMQVLRSTYISKFRKTGLNPYNPDHNIALGTLELKMHLNNQVSRNTLPDRSAYSRMWGRYNGAGANSNYVKKAFIVLDRLEKLNIDQLKSKLKKGPIWK